MDAMAACITQGCMQSPIFHVHLVPSRIGQLIVMCMSWTYFWKPGSQFDFVHWVGPATTSYLISQTRQDVTVTQFPPAARTHWQNQWVTQLRKRKINVVFLKSGSSVTFFTMNWIVFPRKNQDESEGTGEFQHVVGHWLNDSSDSKNRFSFVSDSCMYKLSKENWDCFQAHSQEIQCLSAFKWTASL